MTRRKQWLLGSAGTLLLGFVAGIGPWPLDKTPEAEPEREALAVVAREAAAMQKRHAERLPGRLHAGWAAEPFDLPPSSSGTWGVCRWRIGRCQRRTCKCG